MYMDNIPILSSSTRLNVFLTISLCDQCHGIGPQYLLDMKHTHRDWKNTCGSGIIVLDAALLQTLYI